MKTKRMLFRATWIAAALLASVGAASVRELEDLVSDARSAVLDFTSDPAMDWFRDHVKDAKGVLIIPRLLKGGFIFGGSGGSGVLLARDPQTGAWSYPAFYTFGSVTAGAQIGGEAAQVMLMVMTKRGLDSMMATSVKLGADIEAAAGPVGVGTKAATADVLAFSRTKGLFGGATVEGAWIQERKGWNEEYYGRPVRPIEILLEHKVSNPKADPLRQALAQVAGGAVTSKPVATLR
jgi:lipid-binding SYLF domain-containing protein